MDEIILTPEEEAEAARIEDILKAGTLVEIRYIARLLASQGNRELFGTTETRGVLPEQSASTGLPVLYRSRLANWIGSDRICMQDHRLPSP